MSDEETLAETNPALHRGVGSALCGVATAMNAEIGPTETARMLFALWIAFTAKCQPPEVTAAFLTRIATELESGENYPRSN